MMYHSPPFIRPQIAKITRNTKRNGRITIIVIYPLGNPSTFRHVFLFEPDSGEHFDCLFQRFEWFTSTFESPFEERSVRSAKKRRVSLENQKNHCSSQSIRSIHIMTFQILKYVPYCLYQLYNYYYLLIQSFCRKRSHNLVNKFKKYIILF